MLGHSRLSGGQIQAMQLQQILGRCPRWQPAAVLRSITLTLAIQPVEIIMRKLSPIRLEQLQKVMKGITTHLLQSLYHKLKSRINFTNLTKHESPRISFSG